MTYLTVINYHEASKSGKAGFYSLGHAQAIWRHPWLARYSLCTDLICWLLASPIALPCPNCTALLPPTEN